MSVPRSLCRLVVLGAVLVPMARAQVATSTNYQLADFTLDGGGGGTASIGHGAWVSVGVTDGGTLSSTNFSAGVGILETTDFVPQNAPIVFGLSPDFGTNAGGSFVTVSGYNFDKFGVGPSVTMSVDGNPATGVSVLSNTQLTATVPAGVSGLQGVVVTSSLGSNSDPDAWIYTPAVLSTEATQVGGEMDIRNYGTPGNAIIMMAAAGTGSGGTQFGTFLLAHPFIFVFIGVPYPGPDGIHTLHVDVPNAPILSGLTVYFQSLEATQLSPVQGQFTNRTSVTFQ
jgi:hypothetical protein